MKAGQGPTCVLLGSSVAGIAVDCRYAEKSFPQRACRSFNVAATSVRKVLLAASRTSTPPCVDNICVYLVRHVLHAVLVIMTTMNSVDINIIVVVTTIVTAFITVIVVVVVIT